MRKGEKQGIQFAQGGVHFTSKSEGAVSVYPRLHRILAIPEGYYRDGATAPRLSPLLEKNALTALKRAGEITGGSTEALLTAMCASFERAFARQAAAGVKQWSLTAVKEKKSYKPSPDDEEKKAKRLTKKAQIMDAFRENPKASATRLAEKFNCDESTIRMYRGQMRAAGEIA